jgi:hypothetical protein
MQLHRLIAPAALLLFPALSAGACSSSSPASSSAPTGPVAHFALTSGAVPSFMDVPFPSDVYLQNGHVVEPPSMNAVVRQNSQFISQQLTQLDGFSRVALALFTTDDPNAPLDDDGNAGPASIDATTLPADEKACAGDSSAVFLIDLDAQARVPCRGLLRDDAPASITRPVIAVGPSRGTVLEEGKHYAAVLTSRVKDMKGRALGATASFTKATTGGSPVYTDALTKVTAVVGGALASDGAKIVALAPYTTNTTTKELFALRDALETAPAAALHFDAAALAPMGAVKFAATNGGALPQGFAASLDDYLGVVDANAKLPDGTDDPDITLPVHAHDKIAVIATGEFDAINYLQSKPMGYGDPIHATFQRDGSGAIIPAADKPTSKIWVTIVLPRGAMPAGGWPVVIAQHGLNGSRSFVVSVANIFAAKGFATVGIDSVTFGARAPETKWQTDSHTDYEKAPGAKYAGADGISDADGTGARNGSNDLFGNLMNVGAIRDQFRQAAFDTSQLVKVLRSSPDLSSISPPGTTAKFDPEKIVYFGDSLGAIEGTVAAAIEPHVKAWTLNVVGGGLLIELGSHAPAIGTLLALAGAANFGFLEDRYNEAHTITNLIQTVADPGDPLPYASALLKSPRPLNGAPTQPRNMFAVEVVWDELVANEANEALARAAGYGLATPNVGTNAGVRDIKNLANNPGRMVLPDVNPDANGLIHDTPMAGVTAVMMQSSPGTHGQNIVGSHAKRQFIIPYGQFDTRTPFPRLDDTKDYQVPCPYRELQAAMVRFFADAVAGNVPNVQATKTPVRDVDADGTPDDTDPDPNDPSVK